MIERGHALTIRPAWSATVFAACVGLGVFASVAAAQVAAPPAATGASWSRVELWGGLVVPFSGMAGSVESIYSPPFSGTVHRSEASQTLTLDGSSGLGFETGAAVYPGRFIGIEGRFEVSGATVGGTSSSHHVLLDYTALYPPSYQPVRNVVEFSTSWPDPRGELRRITVDIDLAGRFRLGSRARGRLSGGLSLVRVSGPLESFAFTVFWLGGHSVLFSETYGVATRFEPTWTAGLNLGGGIDIDIARHVALLVDARVVAAGSVEPPVVIVDVVNRDEVVRTPDLDQIRSGLTPGPTEIGLARSRLLVGVKVLL